MDKNSREKDMLYQWAKSNSGKYHFQGIDESSGSYFEQREEKTDSKRYIREYGIESLPELMKELDALWETDETMGQMKKAIAVAALKNKPVKQDIQKETKTEDKTEPKDKMPVFIYNF